MSVCSGCAEGGGERLDNQLLHAAEIGHPHCMTAALAGIVLFDEFDIPRSALCHAASSGQVSCMELAHSWGATDANEALAFAAGAGYLECCLLAVRWGANNFDEAMRAAARGGRVGCMAWARSMGATEVEGALQAAAECGREDCMQVAKVMGAVDFDEALSFAASNGHLGCMVRARRWGARRFDDAMYFATQRGHVHAMDLVRAWGATNYRTALRVAATNGHVAGMERATRWGATNFIEAMDRAMWYHQPTCVRWLLPRCSVPLVTLERLTYGWESSAYEPENFRIEAAIETVLALVEPRSNGDIQRLAIVLHNRATATKRLATRAHETARRLIVVAAQRVHALHLDAYIALFPLDLPLYVIHWILEWVEPNGLSPAKRVRLLENIRTSVRVVKAIPPAE